MKPKLKWHVSSDATWVSFDGSYNYYTDSTCLLLVQRNCGYLGENLLEIYKSTASNLESEKEKAEQISHALEECQ